MAKKNMIILGLAIVILVIVVVVLATMTKQEPVAVAPQAANKIVSEDVTVENLAGETINVVNPGKAIDSSEIAPEQLELIPLNNEAVITYGLNGLETKIIRANAGARVFLSFVAEDEDEHMLSFSDPSMASVLVVFSKAEGNKSINFLAPGVGTYEYIVDGTEKGTLIIE